MKTPRYQRHNQNIQTFTSCNREEIMAWFNFKIGVFVHLMTLALLNNFAEQCFASAHFTVLTFVLTFLWFFVMLWHHDN